MIHNVNGINQLESFFKKSFGRKTRMRGIQMLGRIGDIMQEDDYWFAAKTFGWGWGLPLKWQGWVVYGAAFFLLAAIFIVFPPAKNLAFFLGGTWVVIFLLVTVCWLKGEPPRWRWRK